MKVDLDAYYVYFYRGGRDPMEHLAIVPKELFDKLKPHEEDLDDCTAVPADVQAEVDKVWDLPDLSDAFSDRDYDRIPDEHFVRVTLC